MFPVICIRRLPFLVYMLLNIFRRKYGSLDRISEIKTKLAHMPRVGEIISIFGFRIILHVYSKKIPYYNLKLRYV